MGNKADKLIKVNSKVFADAHDLSHLEVSALDLQSLWPLKDFLNTLVEQHNADYTNIDLVETKMFRTQEPVPSTPIRATLRPVHVKLDISPYIYRKACTTAKPRKLFKPASENAALRQSRLNSLRSQLKGELGSLQVVLDGRSYTIPVRKLDTPLALGKEFCRREGLPLHCADEAARAISKFKSAQQPAEFRPLLDSPNTCKFT